MKELKQQDFYIGQKIYLIPFDSREHYYQGEFEVKKIGRKYIHLNNGSFIELPLNIKNQYFSEKGFGSRGCFFFSKEESEAYPKISRLKNNIALLLKIKANGTDNIITKEKNLKNILNMMDELDVERDK